MADDEDFNVQRELAKAGALKGQRNRDRIKNLRSNDPLQRGLAAKTIGQQKAAGNYTDRQAQRTGKGNVLEQADQRGAPLSELQKKGLKGKRDAEAIQQDALNNLDDVGGSFSRVRNKDRKKKKDKEAKAKKAEGGSKERDQYLKNPITLRTHFAFLIMAMIQDFVPALFDVVFGIGWLIGYVILPLTWGLYLYLIVRRAPRSLRRKFIMRTALISSVALIPYLGELLPEWMATSAGSWLYLRRYEAGLSTDVKGVSSTAAVATAGK